MKQEKQNCLSAENRPPYSRSRLRSIAVGATRFRCNRDNLLGSSVVNIADASTPLQLVFMELEV